MINTVILVLVIISFLMIITEDLIHINKAKTTLFFGTLCWILAYIFPINNHLPSETTRELNENLLEIATLWLFLMSAMTFVAYLNSKGFISALVQRIFLNLYPNVPYCSLLLFFPLSFPHLPTMSPQH